MTKTPTNKQFVSEVARIMNKGQHFEGDISKAVLLENSKKCTCQNHVKNAKPNQVITH